MDAVAALAEERPRALGCEMGPEVGAFGDALSERLCWRVHMRWATRRWHCRPGSPRVVLRCCGAVVLRHCGAASAAAAVLVGLQAGKVMVMVMAMDVVCWLLACCVCHRGSAIALAR